MARFCEEVAALNGEVRKFNLVVPMAWQQQALLEPSRELEKALLEFEQLANDQREAQLQRARKQQERRRLHALRNPKSAAGAFSWTQQLSGANFAINDAQPMPSMFVALREVLEDLLRGTTRRRV